MSGYRIMSFDGGPAALTVLPCLIALERKTPGMIAATDLFAGASSGAWTALYLARNMGLVDSKKITGLQLLQSCLAFLESALAAMLPPDLAGVVDAWGHFALGETPLYSYQGYGKDAPNGGVQALMTEAANYGTDTLGSLGRRVVVVAGRASAPWSPRIYDSAEPADAEQALSDVALCSGSFPMVFPIRDGQVDGAMYTNNPAMVGLVQALAGTKAIAPVSPADAIVFTLGIDDGSSNLSNIFMPGASASAAADPPAPSAEEKLTADLLEVGAKVASIAAKMPAAQAQVEAIMQVLTRGDKPLIDDRTADAIRQIHLRLGLRAAKMASDLASSKQSPAPGGATVGAPETEQGWGWIPWLISPLNFLFAAQVLINSQGRGVGDQCQRLLGDRSFRVGPVSLLPSNEAALLLLLGLHDLVSDLGDLTATLWRVTFPGFVVRDLGFQPGFSETTSWVSTPWLRGTP
jgi:patatin-like phospholipase